jgi:2-polyprenyl-3-methyl-5-hydroxy-6-metoxy-1,4-benzoquinol methylase
MERYILIEGKQIRTILSEVRYKGSNYLQHLQIQILVHLLATKIIKARIKENKQGLVINRLNYWLIKKVAYVDRDVRAAWIGGGLAETQYSSLIPFANWANQHWGIYKSFEEFFDSIPNGKILDIGCGTGNMTANLSRIFQSRLVYGLDLNKRAIFFAKKLNSTTNTVFKVDNAFRLEYRGEFSSIFAIEILEHLDSKTHFDFIDGCLRALKPEGLLFLSTPNEPYAVDAEYGHVGFLNSDRWKAFCDRYENQFVEISYIDNSKLLSSFETPIILGTAEDYCKNDRLNRSHFRIVMSNEVSLRNDNAR